MNITIFFFLSMLFRVSLFSTNKLTTTTFHKKFMRINSSRRETFGTFLNAFEVIYLLVKVKVCKSVHVLAFHLSVVNNNINTRAF